MKSSSEEEEESSCADKKKVVKGEFFPFRLLSWWQSWLGSRL